MIYVDNLTNNDSLYVWISNVWLTCWALDFVLYSHGPYCLCNLKRNGFQANKREKGLYKQIEVQEGDGLLNGNSSTTQKVFHVTFTSDYQCCPLYHFTQGTSFPSTFVNKISYGKHGRFQDLCHCLFWKQKKVKNTSHSHSSLYFLEKKMF